VAGGCGGPSRSEESGFKKKSLTAEDGESAEENKAKKVVGQSAKTAATKLTSKSAKFKPNSSASSTLSAIKEIAGAVRKAMPTAIYPMLATAIEKPFDGPDWLFEIKWDGYRAVAFIDKGRVRYVSRNQNELTAQYQELASLPEFVRARRAILDGEIVALDDQGRPSFSLMQQRTGFRAGKARLPGRKGVPVLYYAFDLLYVEEFDLRRVPLEQRKQVLAELITNGDVVRFSDHYPEKGLELFEAAKQKGLEGILAKRRDSFYVEARSRDWLKIKITQRQECVIGGYTDPEGSRTYFGSLVLGLYDKQGRLIHVGQVGTGFDHKGLEKMFAALKPLETTKNPFYGEIGGLRKVHFVRPEMVAEIKFSEWTHETSEGGVKLRAPVFMGLRADKSPKECTLADAIPK
jgi:bifunctional non-homologous end joining protein LigD